MKRYRSRKRETTYEQRGNDLLRPAGQIVQVFARNMGAGATGWYTRKNPPGENTDWSNWNGPIPRRECLARADGFSGTAAGGRFQCARVREGKMYFKAEILIVNVPEVNLPGTHEGAEMVADLARVQFDNLNVGGYNCREYNGIPGSGWSDHAWGDAVDLVPRSNNDKLTDWCVRMARANCMAGAQQFIGSRDGRVYSYVAPNYTANLGGPSSHLTHVHCSYKQHYGADPNCR